MIDSLIVVFTALFSAMITIYGIHLKNKWDIKATKKDRERAVKLELFAKCSEEISLVIHRLIAACKSREYPHTLESTLTSLRKVKLFCGADTAILAHEFCDRIGAMIMDIIGKEVSVDYSDKLKMCGNYIGEIRSMEEGLYTQFRIELGIDDFDEEFYRNHRNDNIRIEKEEAPHINNGL